MILLSAELGAQVDGIIKLLCNVLDVLDMQNSSYCKVPQIYYVYACQYCITSNSTALDQKEAAASFFPGQFDRRVEVMDIWPFQLIFTV